MKRAICKLIFGTVFIGGVLLHFPAIKVQAKAVSLSRKSIVLTTRRGITLKIKNAPSSAKAVVKSSHPSVVSYKASGRRVRLTPKKTGVSTITVAVGKTKCKCKVKVVKKYSGLQAIRLVKQYLKRHKKYVPSHIAVDSISADSILIHGYDDMGTHTATSFWYRIDRRTGKGLDDVMCKSIDFLVQ